MAGHGGNGGFPGGGGGGAHFAESTTTGKVNNDLKKRVDEMATVNTKFIPNHATKPGAFRPRMDCVCEII